MTMKDIKSIILKCYDVEICTFISVKYGLSFMDAFRDFVNSETYKMLIDDKLQMFEFSHLAIFDMWECEKVTGSPLNSVYIRAD